MQEKCEFRINAEFADLLFSPDEGEMLRILGVPNVQKVILNSKDPKFKDVGRLQREINQKFGKLFFYSWKYFRDYSPTEIQSARAFNLIMPFRFEPCGEECGTIYDESTACPSCRAGSQQTSDLVLNLSKIPKMNDLATTIADEWIVSERLANLFIKEQISGVELRPVQHYAKSKSSLPQYYQLVINSLPVALSNKTKLGIDPFDEDLQGAYRCRIGGAGHIAGLNVLSEIYLDKSTWCGADISGTQELIGTRRGLLRPSPLLIISSRLRNLLLREKMKKFENEIAHLV